MNRRLWPFLLAAALLTGALPAAASANPPADLEPVPTESPADLGEEAPSAAPDQKIYSSKAPELPGFEEALSYFDFTPAAENWCRNFGLDPESETDLSSARQALLAGTSHDFIRCLAAYARDTGHGEGSLQVTNAFRPAAYQELLGLYEANYYTGYFRSNIRWNRESVTSFWWRAEQSGGWPDKYSINLSAYDLSTLNLSVLYRQLLSLWDASYVGYYYAQPGRSNHNSGLAMDIGSDWLGKDFETEHEYNGLWYRMADYGIYKPLQPSPYSAGESWHITCGGAVSGAENYDRAFAAAAEPYVLNYGNPTLTGGSYQDDDRVLYLGAGVALVQLALAQREYLPPEYITGFYCSTTDAAVKAFQKDNRITEDFCGAATCAALLQELPAPGKDKDSPVLTGFTVSTDSGGSLSLSASAEDNTAPVLFSVYTRLAGSGGEWLEHPVCAERSGAASWQITLSEDGVYELQCAAFDAAGNRSEIRTAAATVDHTGPLITYAAVRSAAPDDPEALTLTLRAGDLSGVRAFTLTDEKSGVIQTLPADAAGEGSVRLPAGSAGKSFTAVALDLYGNPGEVLAFTVPEPEEPAGRPRAVLVKPLPAA